MLELLKTVYVFQSPDLAFFKGWAVCCVGSAASVCVCVCVFVEGVVIRGWIFVVFTHPLMVQAAEMAFTSVSLLFLPLKCYFC